MIERTARSLLQEYDSTAADCFWLFFGGCLVFFMQAGFALLEAGSIRAKNVKNILIKNCLDACIGAILWWACGYSFAFGVEGDSPNKFIGGKDFFSALDKPDSTTYYAFWFFQWAFAATAATIVSGAVAERCALSGYAAYTFFLTAFVYPVVVHWTWSSEGWLTDGDIGPGFLDFAGSGVVHMTGGGAALVGAYFLGPRIGKFGADGKPVDIPGHSAVLQCLGTFILWFGWYGFNCCSTGAWGDMALATKCAVTTTMAAAAGGISALACEVFMGKQADLPPILNGILAGLVSITAGCNVTEPWSAFVLGIIGGIVYTFSCKLLLALQIDDPLGAAPVHFFCGAWGVIGTGLFASKRYNGLLTGGSTGGKQLGIQCLGVLAIAAWTCIVSGILFFTLKTLGYLRVDAETEEKGMDESKHGGTAYKA